MASLFDCLLKILWICCYNIVAQGARTTLNRGPVEPDAAPRKIGEEDVEAIARDTQLACEVIGELLARLFVFVRACEV